MSQDHIELVLRGARTSEGAVDFDALHTEAVPTVVPDTATVVGGWLHAVDLDPDEARTRDEVVSEAMARSNVTGPQPLASLMGDVDTESEGELRFEAALRAMR